MERDSQTEWSWTPAARIGAPGDGPGHLRLPAAVAFSPDGALLAVADGGNHRVSLWRRDGEAWRAEAAFGERGVGPDRFQFPAGVAFESDRALLVADQGNHRVCRWARDGDGWVPAGVLGGHGSGPGRFDTPARIACCGTGRALLVADAGNGRVAAWVRNGAWRPDARTAPDADASPPSRPHGVACAADGLTAAVADLDRRHVVILARNDAAGGWDAVAAVGHEGLRQPVAVALTADGRGLLVADAAAHAVSAWTLRDGAWRLASVFGSKGDGPARFRYPSGLALDPTGGLLAVADTLNHRVTVWTGVQGTGRREQGETDGE